MFYIETKLQTGRRGGSQANEGGLCVSVKVRT